MVKEKFSQWQHCFYNWSNVGATQPEVTTLVVRIPFQLGGRNEIGQSESSLAISHTISISFDMAFWDLKGPWHEIFDLWFFSSNNSPYRPLGHGLKPFSIWIIIRRTNRICNRRVVWWKKTRVRKSRVRVPLSCRFWTQLPSRAVKVVCSKEYKAWMFQSKMGSGRGRFFWYGVAISREYILFIVNGVYSILYSLWIPTQSLRHVGLIVAPQPI
jgi:hypothetical protein